MRCICIAMRSVFVAGLGLALALPLAAQQTGRIQGRVVDASTNRPLAGVQVFVPPTGIGNLTDSDGRFLLQNVPAGQQTVTAQIIGFRQNEQTVTVVAGETATLNLTLSQVAISLDEIVVTGAGVATERKKLGNTIATVDADKVRTAAVSDVSQMLAGREPGVSILPSGGYTGQGARIRIRGSSSLAQNNEPIIYIDGIRMDNTSTDFNAQGNPSKLDDIPPESIERIEILKGAAAATLYGTEASNGVIQIFTKKGRQGAPRFTLQIDQTAIDMPLNRVEPLWDFAYNADDVSRIRDRWGQTVGMFEPFTVDLLPTYFKTGHHQAYSLSVTGGSDFVSYFVNARFQDENGPSAFGNLFPDIGLRKIDDKQQRAMATANVMVTPIEKVRISVNTMYSELDQEGFENGNNIYGVWPNLTQTHLRLACDEVGPLCPKTNLYGSGAFITANEAVYQINEVEANHFTGSVNVNYAPLSALRLDGTFGVDFINESGTFFRPFGWNIDNYVTANVEGTRSADEARTRVLTGDFKTSWDARFGESFSNRLLAGAQGFLRQRTDRSGSGTRFPGPGLEVTGAGADQSVSESWNRNTQVGVYFDNQIGYRDWAFMTFGLRLDANSAFGESFDWAKYPKLNASILPTEAFGWTSETFSTIRVRGAIGRSGLQPSSFAKFTTYSPQPSSEGPGVRPSNLGNDNLRPEVATEIEFGAELGMFNDRASLNVTYWTTEVEDAIVSRQFPVSGGFINTQLDNIGLLKKHGFDVGVQGTVFQSDNFSINLFANGAYLHQNIADLGGAPALKTGGSYSRYRQYLVEGYAPGSFFAAKTADLEIPLNILAPSGGACTVPTREQALAYFSQARDPGDFKPLVVGNTPGTFGEANGTVASHNCGTGPLATYLGKSTPDWQGTFGFNAGFLGNFELNSMWEFKAGDFVSHDLSGEFRRTHAGIGRNTPDCVKLLSVMRNPGSTADQRLDSAIDWARTCEGLAPLDGLNSINPSDYVRWRELTLTYRVPTSFADRFGLASAQVSVGARNLVLWVNDAFTGMDPEAVTNGRCNGGLDCNFLDATDLWQVPIPRRITIQTRVSF